MCRRETTLNVKGVAGLPNNFTLSALVEEVTMQEKLIVEVGQDSDDMNCQACDEENEAISKCLHCDHFLCQECQRAHDRMTVMKSHQVYTMAELRSGEIAYKSKLREEIPKCDKHLDQNLSVYCETCAKLVCNTCSGLGHVNHDLIGIPEVVDKCKEEVAELVAEAEKSKVNIITAMEQASESRNKLNSAFAETNGKISQMILEMEHKLKQEAEHIYNDKVKTFETDEAKNSKEVTLADHKLDEVNRLMAQGSSHEILHLKSKLLHNLKELIGIQPEKLADNLSLDFEGERSLRRLVLEDEQQLELPDVADEELPSPKRLCTRQNWELKTKITAYASQVTGFEHAKYIAAFSNNEMVVVDNDDYRRTCHFINFLIDAIPQQLFIIPQTKSNSELTGAKCVSVNKNDQLIVLNHSDKVQIFNQKYQRIDQFRPGRGSDWTPTCLAVDDNNMIAVGYMDNNEISLHTADRSVITTLPAPGIGEYLTIYKQRLIYTNGGEKKLLSIDYKGDLVFSVDAHVPTDEFKPVGVCCDSDGSIYVATKTSSGTHKRSTWFYPSEIHQYSPDGKYIGCVIKDFYNANDITFTPGGDLVVAAGKSVRIYHRV